MESAAFDENDQRPDKPRGVAKAKVADIESTPTIIIYHQPHRGDPNHELVKLPKAAATLFSNKIFKSMRNDEPGRSGFYTITGGDNDALKLIFTWIQECIDQETVTKFPDIPEPESDPFKPTLNVLTAANLLEIPAGSLSFFVEKRLYGIARKHLMPFHQVYEFYEPGSGYTGMGLQKVACASIFNAWWDSRLDESETPELMGELADLRNILPELDQDLHDAVEEKKAFVERSRLERRLKREAEETAGQQAYDPNATSEFVNTDSNSFSDRNINVGGGWDTSPTEVDTNADWMKKGNTTDGGTSEWDEPAQSDWADEVNGAEQQFVPTTSAW